MTYMPIVVLVVVLGYWLFIRFRASRALSNIEPAFRSFFERTGYQYPDMLGQPPDAQAARAASDARAGGQISGFDYIRDFHGVRVEHHARWGYEGRENGKQAFVMSVQWDAHLTEPARVGIQISDKRLESTMHAVANRVLHNKKRSWSPRFEHRVQTGIPQIDQKYVVTATDADAARAIFASQPALVALLEGWAELDVYVHGNMGTFADPEFKNMTAGLGGTIGNMAMGFDYQKRLDLSIPVHDRVAELLVTLARAAR